MDGSPARPGGRAASARAAFLAWHLAGAALGAAFLTGTFLAVVVLLQASVAWAAVLSVAATLAFVALGLPALRRHARARPALWRLVDGFDLGMAYGAPLQVVLLTALSTAVLAAVLGIETADGSARAALRLVAVGEATMLLLLAYGVALPAALRLLPANRPARARLLGALLIAVLVAAPFAAWRPVTGAVAQAVEGGPTTAAVVVGLAFALSATLVALWVLVAPHEPRAAAFSADGRVLAVARGSFSRVFDVAGGRLLRRVRGGRRAIAVDPAGARVASDRPWGVVVVHDVATGEVLLRLGDALGPLGDLAFSHDGTRLAGVDTNRGLHVWDASTGALLVQARLPFVLASQVTFSADDRVVVAASHAAHVARYDASTGALLGSLAPDAVRPAGHVANRAALRPDGGGLACAVGAGGFACRTVVVHALSGKGVTPLRTLEAPDVIVRLGWSADGARLAATTARGEALVWDVARGEALASLAPRRVQRTDAVALDAAGGRLALADAHSTRVVILATGEEDVLFGVPGRVARPAGAAAEAAADGFRSA